MTIVLDVVTVGCFELPWTLSSRDLVSGGEGGIGAYPVVGEEGEIGWGMVALVDDSFFSDLEWLSCCSSVEMT